MVAKILFADDDLLMRQLYRPHIESEGYQWIVATNGREAIQAIEHEKPSLAVIDIVMPEMDGLEVLLEVRQSPRAATMPVILITAESAYYGHRSSLGSAGASLLLIKPFGPKQLVNAIRRLLPVEA